jgi:CubicO group peptidase (beta-lactamase class C family)
MAENAACGDLKRNNWLGRPRPLCIVNSDGKTPGFGIYRRLKEKVGEDFSRFRLWSTAKAVVAVGIVALNRGF